MADAKPAAVGAKAPKEPKPQDARPNPEPEVTGKDKPKNVYKVGDTTIEDY